MGGLKLGKVQARGQVTLPKETRREAGIKPGDTLTIEVVGPGELRCKVLPVLSMRELWERYHVDGPVDWTKLREEAEADAAEEFMREFERQ